MSQPNRTKPWLLSLGGVLLVALLAVAGYLVYPQLRPSKEVINYPVPGAEQVLTVTGKKVPRSIKASITTETLPLNIQDASKGIISQGNVLQVTPSGRLGAPMSMTFLLQHAVTKGGVVFVAYHEKAGDPWEYQQVVVKVVGKASYGTITMPHLTSFWPFEINFSKLLYSIDQEVADDLTGDLTQNPEKPTCSNSKNAASDGYTITKIEKQAIYTCFGMEKVKGGTTKRVVKITSHMRYALELDHTKLFTVESSGAIQAKFAQLARIGLGPARSILFPGDTAVLSVDVPYGKNAMATTKYSGWAAMFNRLDIALDAITVLFTKLNGKAVLTGSIKQKTAQRWERLATVLQATNCSNAFMAKNIGKMLAECLMKKEVIESLVKEVAGVFISAFISIGAELLNWLTAEFQSLVAMFTKNDQAGVNVTRVNPVSNFLGTYQMYRSSTTIKANGTIVVTEEFGLCEPDTSKDYCREVSTYTWKYATPTRLRATQTSYKLVNETTGKVFDNPTAKEINNESTGQQYSFDLIHPGVITVTADNSLYQSGNPTSCNTKVAAKKYWDKLCHVNGY